VREVIAFRDSVCVGDKKGFGFIVINQKGIDPLALDMLQKAGIVGIRRAKRRNMERLAKSCGGYAVNALEGIEVTTRLTLTRHMTRKTSTTQTCEHLNLQTAQRIRIV
jgi:chaperonin GroEL (HSP60 family)